MAGDQMNEQTLGVRIRGESRITFCHGDGMIRIGDWVIIPGSEGEQDGLVVLTEDQIVLAETDAKLPLVLRRATEADLQPDVSDHQSSSLISPDDQTGFGGTGFPVRGGAPARGTSFEDEKYRELKSALPRLGDLMVCDEGEMMVVGVNLRESTLTIRRIEGAETRTISLQDVRPRMGSARNR